MEFTQFDLDASIHYISEISDELTSEEYFNDKIKTFHLNIKGLIEEKQTFFHFLKIEQKKILTTYLSRRYTHIYIILKILKF